uniref:SnoaL-like domain-containing protein n=1 Tax=Acrobeloides nanus TaxID=290746 RepID=A0A914CDC2_9BILA
MADVASAKKLLEDFEAAFASGDTAKLRSLFTLDATAVNTGKGEWHGAEIDGLLAGFMQQSKKIKFNIEKVDSTPDFELVIKGDFTLDDGSDKYPYIFHCKKQGDGSYLIVKDEFQF